MVDEIRTERLVLRSMRDTDAADVHAYRGDAEVARFQSWEPQTLDEVRAYIADQDPPSWTTPGWYQRAIALQSNDVVIGDLGVHILDAHQVELGFTLAAAAQGQGYAAEAVRAMLDHLFGVLAKHRVIASTDPRNERSIALLRRVGFRLEAHHHESLWFKNAWADDLIFALLRRDWSCS